MTAVITPTARKSINPSARVVAGVPVRGPVKHKASDCLPVYGVGDGVLTFRHGLRARERSAIDRALAIVGRTLRGPGEVFTSPAAVSCFLRLHLAGEQHERFAVLFLDAQHRVIACEFMFTGTLTQTSVHPREVVLAALRHGASSVVLAHNHPSGNITPSRSDEALTATLRTVLALIDVRVLDHIIVAGERTQSMAELGLM